MYEDASCSNPEKDGVNPSCAVHDSSIDVIYQIQKSLVIHFVIICSTYHIYISISIYIHHIFSHKTIVCKLDLIIIIFVTFVCTLSTKLIFRFVYLLDYVLCIYVILQYLKQLIVS